jgi:hypothetical protein
VTGSALFRQISSLAFLPNLTSSMGATTSAHLNAFSSSGRRLASAASVGSLRGPHLTETVTYVTEQGFLELAALPASSLYLLAGDPRRVRRHKQSTSGLPRPKLLRGVAHDIGCFIRRANAITAAPGCLGADACACGLERAADPLHRAGINSKLLCDDAHSWPSWLAPERPHRPMMC